MPYPSEHSARVRSPGEFQEESFRRKNIAPGIDVILGKLQGEDQMSSQAFRFSKGKITAEEAKKWLEEHGEKVLSFEPAMEGKKDGARRLDNIGSFHKTERLPNGSIRIPATITRAGVFEYRQPDGSVRRELRPPEEVFSERSLDSLRAVVVTNGHPDDILVTPENSKREMAGFSSERLNVNRNEGTVDTILTVVAKDALEAIEGGRRELSCGYECQMDMTSGEHPVYGRYDAIQRDIVYNHIAIVDVARGGPKLILHLDSADAIGENTATIKSGADMKYKIDEQEIELSEEAHKVIDAAMKKRDGRITELEGSSKKDQADATKKIDGLTKENTELKSRVDAGADKLQAKIDTLTSENATLKADNEKHKKEDAARRDSALVSRVKPYMPKDWKSDGMERASVMSAFIKHVDANADLVGRSDAYIEARVDTELARLDSARADSDELGEQLLGGEGRRTDATDPIARKDQADKDAREAWKKIPGDKAA